MCSVYCTVYRVYTFTSIFMWWYVLQVAAAPWWLPVNNSDWKHPVGPGSSIDNMSVSLCVQYVVTSYIHSCDIVYLTTSLNLLFVGGVEIFFQGQHLFFHPHKTANVLKIYVQYISICGIFCDCALF